MTDITLEKITKYIEDIWQSKNPAREIELMRWCRYRGMVNESTKEFGINHCGHEDCAPCNNLVKMFNKHVQEAIKEYNDLDKSPEAEFSFLTTDFRLCDGKIITINYDPIEHTEDSESTRNKV